MSKQKLGVSRPPKKDNIRKAFGLFKRLNVQYGDGVEYQKQQRQAWNKTIPHAEEPPPEHP